ncbi:MAG: hypothetical protein WDW38_002109 [Sanguina aurantia]
MSPSWLVIPGKLLKLGTGFMLGYCSRAVINKIKGAGHKSDDSSARPGGKKTKGQGSEPPGASSPKPSRRKKIPAPTEELKMVLCVNLSLKMGVGKTGAQCAHAAVGVLQEHLSAHSVAIHQWAECGQPKIALKAADEEELNELEAAAKQAGLPTYQVHDAGRTQIAAGSQTVLAIGPATKSALDKITGHLKLL